MKGNDHISKKKKCGGKEKDKSVNGCKRIISKEKRKAKKKLSKANEKEHKKNKIQRIDINVDKSDIRKKKVSEKRKKEKKEKKEKAKFLKKKNEGIEDGEETDSENENGITLVPSKFLSGGGDSGSDIDFQNFLKEHNIVVSSSEEENESEAETVENENLEEKKGDAFEEKISGKHKEDKLILQRVMKLLTTMGENVSMGPFLKLMRYYKNALEHFVIEPPDGGMPEKVQEENNKKKRKKKKPRTKNALSMHTDTALFIIFNVIYNIDSIFYNLTNGTRTHVKMKIWSVESIKEKEIFEETEEEDEEKEKEKGTEDQKKKEQYRETSKTNKELTKKAFLAEKEKETKKNSGIQDRKFDIRNIEKSPNFKRYNLLIQSFFYILGSKLKYIGENELLDGIFKLLRRNILRWLIPNRLGVYFLSKFINRFIVSKKKETYFLIFVTIRNLFSLYNEKRETLCSVCPSGSKEDVENHEKHIYLYEKDIFGMYQQIFRLYLLHYGKYYSVHNIRHISFKENCLSELFTFLPNDIKYFFVFRYIQLIIQKIRASYKIFIMEPSKSGDKENKEKKGKKDATARAGGKEKECINFFNMKQFHLRSSYMILLLHFLTKMVTTCDHLSVLSCGMTTIIIVLLKMSLQCMKYVPYNLQIINVLIRLMENKKKYIPLFSYFTCILNGLQKYSIARASSRKKFDVKKLEQFDVNISVEIDESILNEFAVLHQIYDKIYVLLYDYIGLMAQSVSFPEFFILIDAYFKNYISTCKVSHFRTNIKKLLADAKSSIKMITHERKNVNIYAVNDTIRHLENGDFPLVKERVKVLQNYENMNVKKIEATLLGFDSVKNGDETEYDKHMKSIYGTSEEEEEENITDKKEKREKREKRKKRTHADIMAVSVQSNENGDMKKKKKYAPLPETDGLENFSLSSDNEF